MTLQIPQIMIPVKLPQKLQHGASGIVEVAGLLEMSLEIDWKYLDRVSSRRYFFGVGLRSAIDDGIRFVELIRMLL